MKVKNSLEPKPKKLTEKIKNLFKIKKGKLRVIIFRVIIFLASICFLSLLVSRFFEISDFFFKEEVSARGELLKMIGATIGGIVLLWGLWINNRRVKEQTRQNEISEKAQINTRFKDASILLGSADTSSQLAGIYALHQTAMDAHKNPVQVGFVEVIHNILCAFARENFKLKELEPKAKEELTSMDDNLNTTTQYEPITTPTIILQTIMDVLFNNEGDIYAGFKSNLSNCCIEKVNLIVYKIDNVDFRLARLSDVDFLLTTFSDVNFMEARLTDVSFEFATLPDVGFLLATLSNVNFMDARLTDVNFLGARLTDVNFGEAEFSNVGFSDTKLQDYSLEEITKEGRSLELTKSTDE